MEYHEELVKVDILMEYHVKLVMVDSLTECVRRGACGCISTLVTLWGIGTSVDLWRICISANETDGS